MGLALAAGLRSLLMNTAAGSLPLLTEVRIDWAVAAFDLAVSLAAPAFFGLIPAFANQGADALADRTHAASAQSRRARNLLVSAEIAFSMMLVTGAGLLVESLVRLEHVDPGFQTDRAMTFHVNFSTPRYREDKAVASALDQLVEGLKSARRIVEAGATAGLRSRARRGAERPRSKAGRRASMSARCGTRRSRPGTFTRPEFNCCAAGRLTPTIPRPTTPWSLWSIRLSRTSGSQRKTRLASASTSGVHRTRGIRGW